MYKENENSLAKVLTYVMTTSCTTSKLPRPLDHTATEQIFVPRKVS